MAKAKGGAKKKPVIDAPTSLSAFLAGETTSKDLVEHYLKRAEEQADLNVVVTPTPEIARAQAKASDARRKKGAPLPLDGAPIYVKDNFCTKGVRTTAAARILSNFTPTYESTVTERLWSAGAVMLGKTNLDAFGMGSSTTNTVFEPAVNPVGRALGLPDLVCGGSSGGSAGAVAAGLCLAALGTDTGGSVRMPASFCGVVGMKPTYGLCSRYGVIAYASSFDQPGVIAQTVDDVWTTLRVMIGEDAKDSTSATPPQELLAPPAYSDALKGKTIGFPKEFLDLDCAAAEAGVWRNLRARVEELGGAVKEIAIRGVSHALPAYYIIAMSEASSNLARYDGVRYGFRHDDARSIEELYERSRSDGFSSEVKRRIILGTYCLSSGYYDAYYDRACRVRRVISESFADAFQSVDALAWPTTPGGAFALDEKSDDPVEMYQEDIFTVPVNLAGLPGINIPMAQDARGMPIGATIVGPGFGDRAIVEIAHALDQLRDG